MRNPLCKLLLASVATCALLFGSIVTAEANTSKVAAVYFDSGSSVLTKEAKKKLNSLVANLNTGSSVSVNGYVQKAGSDSNNKKLSKARAKAVAKYLKSKGVIVAIDYSGKSLPASNRKSTKARRVSVYLTTAEAPTAVAKYSFSGKLKIFTKPIDGCSGHFTEYVKLASEDGLQVFEKANIKQLDSSQVINGTDPLSCDYSYSFSGVPAGKYVLTYGIDCSGLGATCGTSDTGEQSGVVWWARSKALLDTATTAVNQPASGYTGLKFTGSCQFEHFRFKLTDPLTISGNTAREDDYIQDYSSLGAGFLPLPGTPRMVC